MLRLADSHTVMLVLSQRDVLESAYPVLCRVSFSFAVRVVVIFRQSRRIHLLL